MANIIEAGLRIHLVHHVEVGAELKICVCVSNQEFTFGNIEGNGKVIWKSLHVDSGWKGYQHELYTEMSLNDRERLKQFLIREE